MNIQYEILCLLIIIMNKNYRIHGKNDRKNDPRELCHILGLPKCTTINTCSI